jgi:hypothetical protein
MATKTPAEKGPQGAADHVGKKVFSPGELNQSGEDKDYFHPDNDHQFEVPKDANNHALTPDVEVTPDNRVEEVAGGDTKPRR